MSTRIFSHCSSRPPPPAAKAPSRGRAERQRRPGRDRFAASARYRRDSTSAHPMPSPLICGRVTAMGPAGSVSRAMPTRRRLSSISLNADGRAGRRSPAAPDAAARGQGAVGRHYARARIEAPAAGASDDAARRAATSLSRRRAPSPDSREASGARRVAAHRRKPIRDFAERSAATHRTPPLPESAAMPPGMTQSIISRWPNACLASAQQEFPHSPHSADRTRTGEPAVSASVSRWPAIRSLPA